MNKQLYDVIADASKIVMSPAEVREQRRSFAYGNTNIENARVTRAMVEAADKKHGQNPSK